eukprot:scaffold24638_cov48-Cyclotella_meneghiniana.AAC.2
MGDGDGRWAIWDLGDIQKVYVVFIMYVIVLYVTKYPGSLQRSQRRYHLTGKLLDLPPHSPSLVAMR